MTDDENTPLRRPSHTFLDNPIGSFRGPNSLHNFASSFTRAQFFSASKIDNEIHKKRSFFTPSNGNQWGDEDEDELFDPDLMVPSRRGDRLSTVLHDARHQFQVDNTFLGANEVFYSDDFSSNSAFRSRQNSSAFPNAIPVGKKLWPSQSFASLRSTISQVTSATQLNLRQIEGIDGKVLTVVEGQSTAPQTVFNSINVLIGVGLLALPVGLMKAGWVIGLPLLVACNLITFWTAKLLSRAMDTDPTIMTYADLGYAAYGSTAKLFISILFSIDLLGAGVSLVILLSDSLYALLGDDEVWTRTAFKMVAFFVLTPFTFVPLPVLSIFSLFGIMATISITCLVLTMGLIKQSHPGSLIDSMPTNLWPQSWPDFLLSIGILMAPFGGHAIFPNLKSDMRHPNKFGKTLVSTYMTALVTDLTMAVIGFLMFGVLCNNEITNNVLTTPGYPKWAYPLISGLICIVPLAKTPLNAKPIILTLDNLMGLELKHNHNPFQRWVVGISRFLVRVGVNATFVGLAVVFPEFDRIIGMLGASICFAVCIILPCFFYLKLCDVRGLERAIIWLVIVISAVVGSVATAAVIMF